MRSLSSNVLSTSTRKTIGRFLSAFALGTAASFRRYGQVAQALEERADEFDQFLSHVRQNFVSPFYETGHGIAFQISDAYSRIVRSLENLPEPATFRMALRVQASGSACNSRSRRSASR